jgi:D-sedoheptulose 7-phosphate isomerase
LTSNKVRHLSARDDAADATASSFAASYFHRLTDVFQRLDMDEFGRAVDVVRAAWQRGAQIITLGNGGSAMTALHFATDWSKGVSMATGRSLRARTLLDNFGVLTAYANDLSYDDVFAEQIRHVAAAGDLVLAVSGSGNSENVVRAVERANAMGCETLGLCGYSGGRLRTAARHVVWVRVDDMQIIEDVHATFGHVVLKALSANSARAREDR